MPFQLYGRVLLQTLILVVDEVGTQNLNPAKIPTPALLVTATLPLAPLPTTAVITESFITENELAAVPPKLAAVALVKELPLIVMVVPVGAVVGVNEVMVGGEMEAILTVVVPIPPVLVAEMV